MAALAGITLILVLSAVYLSDIAKGTDANTVELKKINASNEEFNTLYQDSL